MYIWRKRATADWLWRQDYDLERRFGSALAIIERPGKARALVEVCCQTGAAARRVQREFGGIIEKLRPDWLEQLTAKKRTLPLRIGSRLIVDQACAPGPKGVRTIVIPSEAAFGTGEHAGQGEERLVPRSSRRPMAREECSGSHFANRRSKHISVDVCRCAIETFLEADQFTAFVDAGRHYSV